MSDKIRCPKCKEAMFEDALYYSIRDEIICFSGKCLNCGYEITGDSLFEQLKSKFDLDKDFESLEGPLEYALSKVNSSQQEIRNRILESLIKIYEQKAKQSSDEDEVEKYFYKKIGCEQALEGKKYDEAHVLAKLAFFYEWDKNCPSKAAECLKQAVSLEPSEPGYHSILAGVYEKLGKFDEAIKHLDTYYASEDRLAFPSTKEIGEYDRNDYLQRRGELLYKKGAYEEAISFLQRVKYTPNMMKHMIEPEWIRVRQGGEVKTTSDCTILSEIENINTNQLLLKAFFGLKDYDHAMEAYDEILSIDPSYNLLVELYEEGDDEFLFGLLKGLMEKDIDKAFEIMQGIEPEEWANPEDAAMAFLACFLKGNIYLKYYFGGNEEKEELLLEANKCFESVDSVFEDFCWGRSISEFFSNYWGNAPDIWEPLFGPVERILPEAHKNRAIIFDELGKPDEAFVEYKKAAEFDGYDSDMELIEKIEETKSKMFKIYENKLKETVDEIRKLLDLRPLGDSEIDVAQRILMHLESVKDQIPEISQLKDVAQKLGFGVPRHLFKECRGVVEQYFNKVYDEEAQKYSDLPKTKNLWSKIDDLHEKDIINGYTRGLVSLIWAVGGKAGHRSDNPWVDALKIEDAEVVVVATIRFLSWYIETYQKR